MTANVLKAPKIHDLLMSRIFAKLAFARRSRAVLGHDLAMVDLTDDDGSDVACGSYMIGRLKLSRKLPGVEAVAQKLIFPW